MKTDKQLDKYINYIQFMLNVTENCIELPMIEDQDERLDALQHVATASPIQIKTVKKQLERHLTNWQMHNKHEAVARESRAVTDVNIQNRIKAVEAYLKYAEGRGFSDHHIQSVVAIIYKEEK